MAVIIHWSGTEAQQHGERMKACRARRRLYGQRSCDVRDGSCAECEYDMALALAVPASVKGSLVDGLRGPEFATTKGAD